MFEEMKEVELLEVDGGYNLIGLDEKWLFYQIGWLP